MTGRAFAFQGLAGRPGEVHEDHPIRIRSKVLVSGTISEEGA